ncbi:MAG: hypothetical protein U0736_03575 [Gemmataceae bacterium]
MSDAIHFRCPHCEAKFKVTAQHAGRQFDCPKCRNSVTVPKPAAAAPPVGGAAEWDELVAYLRSGKPADISKIGDADVVANVTRYYETVATDPSCPKLSYYLLTANDPTAPAPLLVVKAGERAEYDRAWNFDYMPLLNRAPPGVHLGRPVPQQRRHHLQPQQAGLQPRLHRSVRSAGEEHCRS